MEIKVKISVIVPVHNAGRHLIDCIETIINQTLKDIEIILVLDCPNDGSDLIALKYANNDNRIKIISNSKNLHIGMSRNVGLNEAKGEYVIFSDHDDFRELSMFEEMYESAVKFNSDIVLSGYGSELGGELRYINYPYSEEIFDLELYRKIILGGFKLDDKWRFFILNGGMWNKLFRRGLLIDNNIKFYDNRVVTYEDLLFLTETSLSAKKISLVNKVFYFHKENIGNTSSYYNFNSIDLVINYLNLIYSTLLSKGFLYKYQKHFYKGVFNIVLVSVLNEIKFFGFRKTSLFKIKSLKSLNYVRDAYKLMNFNDFIYQASTFKSTVLRFLIFKYYRY